MMNCKKIVVVLVIVTMLVSSFAGISAIGTNSDDMDVIIINFTFDKPKTSDVIIDGETYTQVSISGLGNSEKEGSPSLPKKTAKVLLPPKSSVVSIDVVKSGKGTISDVKSIELGPLTYSPLSNPDLQFASVDSDSGVVGLYLDESGTHKIDNIAPKYDTTRIYPNEKSLIDLGVQYKRGFPILMVDLYPTQYDATTKTLTYFSDITLKVTTEEDSSTGLNEMYRGLSSDFAVIGDIVDNDGMLNSYQQTGSNIVGAMSNDDGGNMLIITTQALKDYSGSYNLDTLAKNHKNKGMDEVYIVTIEDIEEQYTSYSTWQHKAKGWYYERPIAYKIRECVKDY